jgi:hypothetical protein
MNGNIFALTVYTMNWLPVRLLLLRQCHIAKWNGKIGQM